VRPPHDTTIRRWYEQFTETGIVDTHTHGRILTGRPRRSDEDVGRVKQAFVWSSNISISRESAELPMDANDCPQNSSQEDTSKIVPMTASSETYIAWQPA
jgi:hypothetical protein